MDGGKPVAASMCAAGAAAAPGLFLPAVVFPAGSGVGSEGWVGDESGLPPSLGVLSTPEFFDDHRGRLTLVWPDGLVNFIETVTFAERGVVRGNHYHARYRERAYVQQGTIAVTLRQVGSPDVCATVTVEAGQLLDIPPNVLHTFVSRSPALAICFGYGPTPPTVDRHRPADAGQGAGPAVDRG